MKYFFHHNEVQNVSFLTMLVLTPNIFTGEEQKLKTYEEYNTENVQIKVVLLHIFSPSSEMPVVLFQAILKQNV